MKKFGLLFVTMVLALSVASPAFAATGAEFGAHHAAHAQEMTGFTGTMNPGVKHLGFSAWMGM